MKYIALIAALAPAAARAEYCGNLLAYGERVLGLSGACAPAGSNLLSPEGCDAGARLPAEAADYIATLSAAYGRQCRERSAQAYRRAASPLTGQLSFLPEPGAGMGFWCEGWKGAPMPLRAGPAAAARVLAQIAPGDDFVITEEDEGAWSFLWNEQGAMGWTLAPPESFGHCVQSAG